MGSIPCLPGRFKWGKRGIKSLGVFLGNEDFQRKNWEGVQEKVRSKVVLMEMVATSPVL